MTTCSTWSTIPTALSANAYLGSGPIVDALDEGADVVLTGRVADASLFAAPVLHAHGWPADDWDRVAHALVAGHLLECAGQLTGGYFADPGVHDVAGLAELGFPFADVGRRRVGRGVEAPGHGRRRRHAHVHASSCSTKCTTPAPT